MKGIYYVYQALTNERLSNTDKTDKTEITDKTMHMIILLHFYQKILDLKITEDLNLTIIEEIALATITANEELENMHGLDMFQRIITKKRCQLLKHRGKKEIPVKML